jgi:hypothetical protein
VGKDGVATDQQKRQAIASGFVQQLGERILVQKSTRRESRFKGYF